MSSYCFGHQIKFTNYSEIDSSKILFYKKQGRLLVWGGGGVPARFRLFPPRVSAIPTSCSTYTTCACWTHNPRASGQPATKWTEWHMGLTVADSPSVRTLGCTILTKITLLS
jgi:hypothetical protein